MRARTVPTIFSALFFFFFFSQFSTALSFTPPQCKAWLVQSIPTDMPQLQRVPGVLSTGDVFVWLAGNSTQRLDIIAQYWELLASPDDSRSGDYGYSNEDLKKFGAYQGYDVYTAIEKAADRNVTVRLVSHSGVSPHYGKEPADLASGRPNVQNVTLLLGHWYGSGIVHSKVWISDDRDVYIGSANQDWKSLSQVKELGIYLTGCPTIAADVKAYFDNLLKLAFLNDTDYTRTIFDQQWQIHRKVPCWSYFVDPESRCRSPLPPYVNFPHILGYPSISDPYTIKLSIQTPGSSVSTLQPHSCYLSFAPPELLFGRYQSDEQAWSDTIKSVGNGATVRISTMDWLGQSQFTTPAVYWSSLSSAISEVIFSKNATVKLLVSYWTHSVESTDPYLKSLLYSNILCNSSKFNDCFGKVEIKYYVVPGYNETGPALFPNGTRTKNTYPGFGRVQHGKFAVSDVRAHIGTSNLEWDYFYATSGISFGTYNLAIVKQLQEVFEADWNSPYTVPVKAIQNGLTFSS
ncbi:phospholipase D Y-like [Momordica charantia]|uniref:Phospholipase D Y-like n=1 Tax=Momordica charantia TaxID=3673 RepID=A0A6J1C7D6_MOMCH|nr:phospholipase D Y-like [Momordica charantia]